MDTFILRGSFTGKMTDEEFLKFCLDNPELRIERNSNLEIVIMSPATSLSSFFSGEIFKLLSVWNDEKLSGVTFDASAGFTLLDRSVLSPDACWIRLDRWSALTDKQQSSFAPLCPDFIIEVRSKSDQLSELRGKMKIWIKNGAQIGWLIDPLDETIYIYRPGQSELILEGFNQSIRTEDHIAAGFTLDLSRLKQKSNILNKKPL